MISPQASIPRHWSSPSGERKDEDIERCPIILTSMYDEDTSCPKILHIQSSQPISRRFLAELISLSCTMPHDGHVSVLSLSVTCSNLTSQQDMVFVEAKN